MIENVRQSNQPNHTSALTRCGSGAVLCVVLAFVGIASQSVGLASRSTGLQDDRSQRRVDTAPPEFRPQSTDLLVFAPVPKVKPEKKKLRPNDFLEMVNGRVSVNNNLVQGDPLDPQRRMARKTYTVEFKSGQTYQIDMMSQAFDAYLILRDPTGKVVAQDDDGGVGLNSRIHYRCTSDGEYNISATSCGVGFGPFALEVMEK